MYKNFLCNNGSIYDYLGIRINDCTSLCRLRECSERRDLLSELVGNWLAVVESSQCYLVEAVERLLVGPQVAAAAVQVRSAQQYRSCTAFDDTRVAS